MSTERPITISANTAYHIPRRTTGRVAAKKCPKCGHIVTLTLWEQHQKFHCRPK